MKVFISLKALRGDVERETLADSLSAAVKAAGHVPFVASREIARAGLTAPQAFMPFVREQLDECALLIVVWHPELRGGLIEVGMAYERRIPIWLCHKADEKISSSMHGCANVVILYRYADDLGQQTIRTFARTAL